MPQTKKDTALSDSFESSQKQVEFKGFLDKAFKSIDDKFAIPATVEDFRKFVISFRNNPLSLANIIKRGDFKGMEDDALKVLQEEKHRFNLEDPMNNFYYERAKEILQKKDYHKG
jgi:hypothetical protein